MNQPNWYLLQATSIEVYLIQNFNKIKTQKPNCENCEILTRASVLQESAQEDFEKKRSRKPK